RPTGSRPGRLRWRRDREGGARPWNCRRCRSRLIGRRQPACRLFARGLEDPAQVVGEVRRGRVAVLLPLRERLEAGPFQFGWDLAAELTRGLGLVVADLPE